MNAMFPLRAFLRHHTAGGPLDARFYLPQAFAMFDPLLNAPYLPHSGGRLDRGITGVPHWRSIILSRPRPLKGKRRCWQSNDSEHNYRGKIFCAHK